VSETSSIGDLSLEYYGAVETLMQKAKIICPIMTPDDIWPENQRVLAMFDRAASNCIEGIRCRYDIKSDIRRCFFLTSTLNAVAMRPEAAHGGQVPYVVGILAGVATSLSNAMHVVSKNPELREFLGLITPQGGIGDVERAPDFGELIRIGYRWIVYHELGHIKNGHLHLDTGTAFGSSAFELMTLDGDEQRNLTCHTLEMDADSVACGQIFGELFSRPYDDSKLSAMLRDDVHRIRAFAVAIFTTLRTFAELKWSEDRMFRYTHPPAGVRMVLIISWGLAYFEKHVGKIRPADWTKECIDACRLVDAAFGRKVNDDPELQRRYISMMDGSPGHPGYVKRLLQRWALIRPKLEPFLLGGELAPPQGDPA
jgi:hypothetical protein